MAAIVDTTINNNTYLLPSDTSNYIPNSRLQIGEKGHIEHSWSSDIREKIVQLHFQLTRTSETTTQYHLANVLRQILVELSNNTSQVESTELLIVLYKMNGHTRDIINGKGEYNLSYMMVVVWYDFYPELAMFVLKSFVQQNTEHPYGSWKDIKYFCNYCRSLTTPPESPYSSSPHPLIQYALSLVNDRLKLDEDIFNQYNSNSSSSNKNNQHISLVAKWIPREKTTRFGWLFQQLAKQYYHTYIQSATSVDQKAKAILKAKTHYRKLISKLNKHLDTVQIKQCANQWSAIDHSSITSITISKQKQSFLNVNKDGSQRTTHSDRITSANNFKEHIRRATAPGGSELKGKRTSMPQFTKDAIELIARKEIAKSQDHCSIEIEMDILNSQWRNNAVQTEALGPMLAMVDFSGSMDGEPRNCAFALAARIAEKSILGKRVLSFSTNPTWHNLESCNTFTDVVEQLLQGEVGLSANFHKAFDRILEVIVEKQLKPEDVSNMVLAVLSDMQIDEAESGSSSTNTNTTTTRNINQPLYNVIEQKYADAGMRIHGKPFKPPHILFWNLRTTNGFPSISTQPNTSMVSGHSPALLNTFCEKGTNALIQSCTPWAILSQMVNHQRYQILEEKIKDTLNMY